MIDLLIDRVGNVNVFNFLVNGETNPESHLQSVMDDDLILEYINEIENLSKVSQALQGGNSDPDYYPDILKELKILGETFFLQFFPRQISERLLITNEKYLHFSIDPALASVPWELLHDGNSFFSDRFYIGKTVKGSARSGTESNKDKLKMLIIVDPTEDLEWARKEGEEIFKHLRSKVSPSKLEISFIGGKQISKLKLLSMIKAQNIIHYSGHLFFSDDPLENGWLLSGGKVLKAREIKNNGFSTDLVFSNSCDSTKTVKNMSHPSLINYFAGSFLLSGIKCFIGTNWEIMDNEKTLDFTLRFYLSLFTDKSVGESLYLAKEYARRNYEYWDLTWGNYSLHGTPIYQIFKKPETDIQNLINPSSIMNNYPSSIALAYQKYLELEMQEVDKKQLMEQIIHNFIQYSLLMGVIVFSNHNFQSMGSKKITSNQFQVTDWWEQIYIAISDFKKLEISMVMDSLLEVLYSNRDTIFKMIQWMQKYRNGELQDTDLDGYLVTYQFYFENLLIDSQEFENCIIVLLSKESESHLFFRGIEPEFQILSFPKNDFLQDKLEKYRGRLVLFNKIKMNLLPLDWLLVSSSNEKKKLVYTIDLL